MQRPRRCINIFIWLSSPSAYYHPELKKNSIKYLRVISCDFLIFTSKKLAKFENYNQFEAKKNTIWNLFSDYQFTATYKELYSMFTKISLPLSFGM